MRRLSKLLGWKPEYGSRDGLKRGLQATADWFADEANLRRYKAEVYNL
jgi:hypothetical protein